MGLRKISKRSSQWDGGYEAVVQARTPVYFIIGEDDEYYGSEPFKKAYRNLQELYRKQGLAEEEIDRLAVLDVKGSSYFKGTGITYQHGGGYLFCRDKAVMRWLFEHERSWMQITENGGSFWRRSIFI